MTRKPLVPPRDLFDQLQQDLKTEVDAIAKQPRLSVRQKLDRYLKALKRFDAAWLARLARRKSRATTTARDEVSGAIEQILAAVTHAESLSLVHVPPDVVPLGITTDGEIAPLEYPDRPAKRKTARHLVEFPPAGWEDQRAEALRWGDHDPARWGDERPADDPRPMAERLAEWEKQVAECVRQDAPRRKAAEEIYGPHGLFEQAMPPATLLDRISFRSEREYIERTLRHDLMSCAERLLLGDAPANKGRQIPMARALSSPSVVERINSGKRGRSGQRRRSNDRIRRSQEVHAECDEALRSLRWSAHDWADKSKVSHSTIDRIMNGRTKIIRSSTSGALYEAMKEGLEKLKRTDLLMKSPRWTE
jgi:hypothetical protein